MTTTNTSRRNLLKGAATLAAAAPFAGALQALSVRQARADVPAGPVPSPYGPIAPVADLATGLPLLQLPAGFQYKSFSWIGDPMENGQPVPTRHDGMGVIEVRQGRGGREFVLVRNHEAAATPTIIDAPAKFDTVAFANGNRVGGGTTTLYVPQGVGQPVRTVPSLGGTRTNCAGGVTPWGTWLTCEENTADDTPAGGQKHGYVFEVTSDPLDTTGAPIRDMGRFKHEAVAFDPRTGAAFLTEDNSSGSAYYRFLPNDAAQRAGALAAGGRLQAARVRGTTNLDIRQPQLGDVHELEWVEIATPDSPTVGGLSGPYRQARDAGALRMGRGEGIWHHDGKLYVVDTSAGAAGQGAVWEHDLRADTLRCIYVSPDAAVANNPDNLTVSPRGGLVLCEDGGRSTDAYGEGSRLLGLHGEGVAYIFAKNNVVLEDAALAALGKNVAGGDYRSSEFCGACFDPSGHYLFVNIQSPGITLAIWGPWARGTI
ncbi:PhoX family protein [Vulgatibacter sp.]|uniref:PhoX family protein n=1 Tax=Vulgatibacter sp. TaxID=1971226 RepID=UPI0035672195